MTHRQVLVHGRNHSGDAGEVGGQRVEHAFDDDGVLVVGLDVERDVGRARCIRDVEVVRPVIFHGASVDGVDESLGVAGRDGDAGFVVRFQVVEEERDLVAFDAREHAVAVEGFGVAAVVAETVELRLADVPSALGEEVGRRGALAGGPVAVAYEVLEDARLFAADFLDPGMFVGFGFLFRFLGAQEFHGFGARGRFIEAVETAPHHEFNEVALASALQAAVAPVAQRVVEEQGRLFGRMERAACDKVSAPAAQGNSELPGVSFLAHDSGMFLIDDHKNLSCKI